MATILTWTDDSDQTISVQFDVLLSETHEKTSVVTDHPVEEGVNVADHVRPDPDRLSLEGYVSDKPLMSNPGVAQEFDYQSLPLDLPPKPSVLPITPGAITQTVVNGISSLINDPTPTSYTGMASTGPFKTRSLEAWQNLKDARDNARLITVATLLDVYENMEIERLSAPRQVTDGSGMTIQIDLRQMRIVKSETVTAPVPAEARGQVTKSLGSKNPLKDSDDDASKKKSVALQIVQGLGGFGGLGAGL